MKPNFTTEIESQKTACYFEGAEDALSLLLAQDEITYRSYRKILETLGLSDSSQEKQAAGEAAADAAAKAAFDSIFGDIKSQLNGLTLLKGYK